MFPFTVIIYGTLAAVAAFLLEIIFLTGFSLGLITFIIGALIEEGMKLLFLFQYQKRFCSSMPSSPPLRFLFFALFGIGFAFFEIFLALPMNTEILLALISVHTLTSLILGYTLLTRKLSHFLLPAGLVLAIGIHVTYNLLITSLQ
ncbi:MAG: hypothetical protein KA054_02395 [Candidatus Moranbacteria bacterium]|nr:hypothetical protein [Candidatus Moranbacteria bacterium]